MPKRLTRRRYLFSADFRRQYPMARAFLAPQRDRPAKQPIPKKNREVARG